MKEFKHLQNKQNNRRNPHVDVTQFQKSAIQDQSCFHLYTPAPAASPHTYYFEVKLDNFSLNSKIFL